jgi:Protein of unknown function (DUF1161)
MANAPQLVLEQPTMKHPPLFLPHSLASTVAGYVFLPAIALLHLPGWANNPSGGANCESLRTEIEAKIRARGVSQPSVTVVDAQAQVAGQVVGSCERGSKKIVYRQTTAAPTAAPTSTAATPAASKPAMPATPAMPTTPAAAKKPAAKVITECADGRVLSAGDCSK